MQTAGLILFVVALAVRPIKRRVERILAARAADAMWRRVDARRRRELHERRRELHERRPI